MKIQPTQIERLDERTIQIAWSDGHARRYSVNELRDRCPCATCREKRKAAPPDPNMLTILQPEEAQPLTLQGMKPVGAYAYGIAFGDGHDSGIFTFELLLKLGEVVE